MFFRSAKLFRNIMVMALALGVVHGFLQVSEVEAKVGYINLQRLISESEPGLNASVVIAEIRQLKENQVNEKLQQIKLMQSQFEVQRSKMTADEQRNKIAEIQQANKEYKRLIADAKEEMERENRELVAKILQKADEIVREFAKKKNFTIILKDPNALAYLDEKVDITDEIIKELNLQ